MSATATVLRLTPKSETELSGTPSIITSTCCGVDPRIDACWEPPMPLPVLRTLTSETNCRASASVRNPMRCNSSRGITVTYAGVVVTGWGRFPARVTAWSSNVGGCSGGFLASCALASGGRGFANTPTRITENKNAQWPRLPLGECSTIPPTSSSAKACGEWCGQVFWLPGHRSLRPSRTGTPEGDTHVQWHTSEKTCRLQRRDRAGVTPDFP